MRSVRLIRVFLILSLLCGGVAAWQYILFNSDNSFMDGICAAMGGHELAPETRVMRLFRWVNTYDDLPSDDATGAPRGFLTPRVIVEHRTYFQMNCGSKAWFFSLLARRAGFPARELRLCDAAHVARHVVSEVCVDGRWAVFDPTVNLDFRRPDGQLATAAELRDPRLLAANAARAPEYNLHRWRFDHAERLHFEKVPVVGVWIRRVTPRITGRPAEEVVIPTGLELPRLLAASSAIALALLSLLAAAGSARRHASGRGEASRCPPLPELVLETAEQD